MRPSEKFLSEKTTNRIIDQAFEILIHKGVLFEIDRIVDMFAASRAGNAGL